MKLYYKSGACSLASHIALYETGAGFQIEAVDTAKGRTATGADFRLINPNGYVPALELDTTEILTEGAAVLQWIADSHPAASLAPPPGSLARARLQEALNWISSELHKAFGPLFNANATEAERSRARSTVSANLDRAETMLAGGREWLVAGQFSVADAYLFAVVNWTNFTGIDLARWPALAAHLARVAARPSTQKAMQAEGLI